MWSFTFLILWIGIPVAAIAAGLIIRHAVKNSAVRQAKKQAKQARKAAKQKAKQQKRTLKLQQKYGYTQGKGNNPTQQNTKDKNPTQGKGKTTSALGSTPTTGKGANNNKGNGNNKGANKGNNQNKGRASTNALNNAANNLHNKHNPNAVANQSTSNSSAIISKKEIENYAKKMRVDINNLNMIYDKNTGKENKEEKEKYAEMVLCKVALKKKDLTTDQRNEIADKYQTLKNDFEGKYKQEVIMPPSANFSASTKDTSGKAVIDSKNYVFDGHEGTNYKQYCKNNTLKNSGTQLILKVEATTPNNKPIALTVSSTDPNAFNAGMKDIVATLNEFGIKNVTAYHTSIVNGTLKPIERIGLTTNQLAASVATTTKKTGPKAPTQTTTK